MKTLYLLFSRIRQYFLKNKVLFVYFIIGGMINGIMLTYSYGNLLGTVSNRETQKYKYREYVIAFPEKEGEKLPTGEPKKGFEPEQLEALLANPMVDYARVMSEQIGINRDETSDEILAVDSVVIPYVNNLPLYDPFDASIPQGELFKGSGVLNGPNEVIVGADLDVERFEEGRQDLIFGRYFDIVGTCMSYLHYTYIIPLETFYEMELHDNTRIAYVYAKERQDLESGNDPMEALLKETFSGCRIIQSPSDYYRGDIQNTFETYPLIIACYLICTVSFAFLLRYLVDSTMKESIISIIVGAPKSAIAVTIFWEATVMSLISNGLGFLLHAALYEPVFKSLNVEESLNYYFSDYMYLLMVVFAVSLVVTVPFVMKYMKLSPIAARRAKH